MEALMQILTQQAEYCEALRDICQRKQQALVKADVQDVSNFVKDEEILVLKIGKLEQQRQAELQRLAEQSGWPNEGLSIAKIRQLSDVKWLESLTTLEQRLNTVFDELDKINKHNKNLIEQSLRIVNFNLQLLAGSRQTRSTTYAPTGESSGAEKFRALLDRKV